MESFLLSVFDAAQSAIQACINLWRQILDWAQGSLSDWIRDNLKPALNHLATDALVILDKVAVPVRRLAKKAWKQLRKLLISSLLSFEKKFFDGKYVWFRTWVTKMYAMNEKQNKPVKKEIITEEKLDWEDLPPEVRALIMRDQEEKTEVDFLEGRDSEIAEMDMAA